MTTVIVKDPPVRLAFDCETYLVEDGMLAPPLVCLQYTDGRHGRILTDKRECIDWLRKALTAPEVTLWGHRVAYDLAVCSRHEPRLVPLIFKALDEGRIRDTRVTAQLWDIAEGQFEWLLLPEGRKPNHHSLAQYASRFLGESMEKGEDSWQLRYRELEDVPLESWPPEAVKYCHKDALNTWLVSKHLDEVLGRPPPTDNLQVRSAWALHIMGVWGVRTDPATVATAEHRWQTRFARLQRVLIQKGFLREDGSKDTKLITAAIQASGAPVGWTATGKVSLAKDSLKEIQHLVRGLRALVAYTHVQKYLTTYLPRMWKATQRPFCPAWNTLVSSGRTSCGGSRGDGEAGNIQNLPRSGPVRECYVPRAGHYYCSTDYDTAELRSLAQVHITMGFDSVLAKELREGKDPHLAFAAEELLHISYAEAKERKKDKDVAEARQFAKVFNFGAPGGLGAASMTSYAKASYNLDLPEDRAREIRNAWLDHYPEMRRYFRVIGDKTEEGTARYLIHPVTKFVRGRVTFTEACNHMFQHLTACGAKEGFYRVSRECYTDETSPLYGSRPVMFIHDEVVSELPIERSHEAAVRQAEVMIEGMNEYVTDVPNTCSPALMERLYKGAEAVYDQNKRLLPWRPK